MTKFPQRKAGAGTEPDIGPTVETDAMAPDPRASRSLRGALLTWCDASLVEALRREEVRFTEREHAGLGLPLLSEPSAMRQISGYDWMSGGLTDTVLRRAWARLFDDLRQRVERGELFLEGVRLAPERSTVPEEISNSWAADLEFDLDRNTIRLGHERFGAVTVSTRPSPWQPVLERGASAPGAIAGTNPFASPAPPPGHQIRPADVPSFSDKLILALLEEHGRRVVGSPDAKLISPGKVSLLPIVARKLRHRAAAGELAPTLAAEGKVLAEWIASKVEHLQVPTAATITKVLGGTYWAEKARSNAAIQKANR